MKGKRTLLIIILVFVLIVGGASALYTQQNSRMAPQLPEETESAAAPEESASEEEQKIPAPDFTVYDADGNSYHLTDFIGKPIVLNFWASWCGPCRMEMPDFNEKYLELGDNINFVMVNMTDGRSETIETASEFIKESGYSFPVFYDTSMEAAMNYNAFSLPTTFFIDAEGYVEAQATGAIDADTLQRGIDLIS